MKKWSSFFLLLILFINGCGKQGNDQFNPSQDQPLETPAIGFITDRIGNAVLINDVVYEIDKETILTDSSGKNRTIKGLILGTKVAVYPKGDLLESFPAKSGTGKIVVLTDENSLHESEMMGTVLDQLGKTANDRFIVTHFHYLPEERVYEMNVMNRSNLDGSYKITVDESTYEILFQEQQSIKN